MLCPYKIHEELMECKLHSKSWDVFVRSPHKIVLDFLRERSDDVIVCSHPQVGVAMFSKRQGESSYVLRYIEKDHAKTEDPAEECFENWKNFVEQERARLLLSLVRNLMAEDDDDDAPGAA